MQRRWTLEEAWRRLDVDQAGRVSAAQSGRADQPAAVATYVA